MADDADRSSEREEATLGAFIRRVRERANAGLQPTGQCHNCAEPLEGKVFCCTECREDFDYRDTVRRNTGAK